MIDRAGSETRPARAGRAIPWTALSVPCLVALALRLVLILCPPEELLDKGTVPHEELLRGVATQDILEGALAPLQDYQVNYFWGGSLVMSLLAIPSFLVFGPNAVAMRLPALLFALVGVCCAFLALDRFASRRAAHVGAWLMACAPPGYAILSCTVYGTHMESASIAVGLAYLYLDWRARGRARVARTLGFGAALGLALWFGYGLLLVVLAIAAFEWAEDKLFFARRWFAWLILGFAVGFAPWIRYMATHPGRAGRIYDSNLAEHFAPGLSGGGAVLKFAEFARRDWAESLWLAPTHGLGVPWWGLAVQALVLVALGIVLVSRRDAIRAWARALVTFRRTSLPVTPALFAVVYAGLFVGAYVTSDFVIGDRAVLLAFRYLMPLWPFAAWILAAAAEDVGARGRHGARVAGATAGVLAVGFAASTLARANPEMAARIRSTPAYSLEYSVRFLVLHFGTDREAMDGVVERIEAHRAPAEREQLYRGIARGLRRLSQVTPDATPEARRDARLFGETLEFLATRVEEPYRAIFSTAGPAARSPF